MQLTKVEGYALRAAMDLAQVPASSVKEIARRQNIPAAYLGKIVQSLARAGVVLTSRGQRGGVQLARPAAQINLRQVIEAVQGPVALSRCLIEPLHDCSINGPSCPIRQVTLHLQETVVRELDSITLADLIIGREQAPVSEDGGRSVA
jgi:Rrf2 family transcriptional regulator, iron-sulfur cluster assembly transcription factor